MSGWNGKVTRVDQPEPGLLSLSCHGEGRGDVLVITTLPGGLGVGLVERRPRGASATTTTTQLRRHIEGARVVDVRAGARAVRVSLERGGEQCVLLATASKPYGAWWLSGSNGDVVLRAPGSPREQPDEAEFLEEETAVSLRAKGETVLAKHRAGRLQLLTRALRRHVKRLKRKRDAIAGDLARAEQADALHEQASLLLAHAATIPPDAKSFETPSWSDPERVVRIELDPRGTPTELAQRLFAKAKRLRRGLDVAPSRLAAVDAELAKLDRIATLARDEDPAEVERELRLLGVAITEPRERERKRRRGETRLPYREFSSRDSMAILVGRGAADNDQLTLRVARPADLWLHARGVRGAHVVVRLAKGASCPPETLVDAATLAAHFSDVRGEPVVDVLHTPRRFVRKRKGSPVGSVTLEREKVIAVRVEPARLRRLLDAEKKP